MGQGEDAPHDEGDADHPERREPLVERDEPHDRHERDAGAPSDRIYHGQVAQTVGAPEREEVNGVQQHGPDDERQGAQRQTSCPQQIEHARQIEEGAQHARAEEKGERVTAALGQRVPAGVEEGGAQDEEQRRGAHRPSVRACPCWDKANRRLRLPVLLTGVDPRH
jgi:hypothetical protein